MPQESNFINIMVSGKYACFTRPETRADRLSYEVPTPCALEGMLKSIYWKPAIEYVIDKIIVYNPIKFINVRRNEVCNKVSLNDVRGEMKQEDYKNCIPVQAPAHSPMNSKKSANNINQRTMTILKNVKYGIVFHLRLTGIRSENEINGIEKHVKILTRRLVNGQYFRTPCLGMTEFKADSIILTDMLMPSTLTGDKNLGPMLYSLEFKDRNLPVNVSWEEHKKSDAYSMAYYYDPHMKNGMIDVRHYALNRHIGRTN